MWAGGNYEINQLPLKELHSTQYLLQPGPLDNMQKATNEVTVTVTLD